ncbi:MAG: hypothetical protein AABZ63_05780, partial [Actinomycetota bacterium]
GIKNEFLRASFLGNYFLNDFFCFFWFYAEGRICAKLNSFAEFLDCFPAQLDRPVVFPSL